MRSQSSSVFTVKGMPGGRRHSRIVHEDVDPPELPLDAVEGGPDLRALGHVAAHADGLPAQRLDLPGDMRRVSFLNIGDGDVRALLRHAHDDAFADARAAARHHRHLAVESHMRATI